MVHGRWSMAVVNHQPWTINPPLLPSAPCALPPREISNTLAATLFYSSPLEGY